MANLTRSNTTLEYFDGFDEYTTNQILRYWSFEGQLTASAGTVPTQILFDSVINIIGGRNSTSGIRFTSDQRCLYLSLSQQQTRSVGFAWRGQLFSGTTQSFCVSFADSSTIPQLGLRVNLDGTLSVLRGPGGGNGGVVVAGPSLSGLTLNTYYYLEFLGTIHNLSGVCKVNVNGQTWISATGINTAQTTNYYSAGVFLGSQFGNGSNLVWDYDDFYTDSSGRFWGDVRVESLLPTGIGAFTQFARSGTTNTGQNYSQVNESPANDDTTYNYASGINVMDTYLYPPLASSGGNVCAVMSLPIARNDSAGNVQGQNVYRVSGVNFFSPTQTIGSTSYAANMDIQGYNPNLASSSGNWSISDVNNAQFGYQRTA